MVEWMNNLIAFGYKFPTIHISGREESHKIVTNPLALPTIEGQSYRSFPHFFKLDWNTRPQNAVIKLIMMTKDEWPLIKTWVLVRSSFQFYYTY